MARDYGFVPKVCRPYRARTKGKVERFNGYLKRSFIVPLAATLKQAGLELDIDTANARIGAWLHDVAHQAHTRHNWRAASGAIEQRALVLAAATIRQRLG